MYRFPAVNTGTYKLTFELAGFAPLVRDGIVVPVRQTITVDAAMKLASLQETVTVSGSSPTVDVENTKVGARLDHETLTAVPTSRTIFGSTTVLPGMTMGRQDPGGLNAAASTGMVAHGASTYNLNYYGVTADTPQNYGVDVLHGLRIGRGNLGGHRGDGRGNRRRRRREHQRHPEERRQHREGRGDLQRHGQGLLEWLHRRNNITPDLRAQGITDPTLRKLNDFNANVGGPFLKDRLWWFGSVRQLPHGRSDRRLHDGQLRRQPDQPVRLEPAQLHGERKVSDQQEQSAVGVLDLQQEVPAASRRRRRAAAARSAR